MLIIKRDGTKVEFDRNKIINAISAANNEVEDVAERLLDNEIAYIADEVYSELTFHHHTFTVEEIQDMVENYILDLGNYQVAKKYITYRYTRTAARNNYDTFMKAITEKLEARNVQNQNANIDEYSFGGRIGEATDVLMKEYALKYCVSDLARKRHENNEIYIHDLSHYAVGDHNCLTIPCDDLLAKGFKTRQVDIRPAQSINTAMQLVAVIFQLESLCQFGGVSASHIDWTLVPYVRKSFYKHYCDGLKWVEDGCMNLTVDNTTPIDDDKYKYYAKAYNYALEQTQKEVYQATEAMYHNLNSLQSRSGNQLPFSSVNYGTCTLPEGRMVTKALLDVSIKGLGPLHKTSIFPCGIFQCMKGINRAPGDPNYDLFQLALKSTSLRLYPNYANADWSGNNGYDVNDPRTYFSTMGKRKLQLI